MKTESQKPLRVSFETYRRPGQYEKGSLMRDKPSCFNGVVSIKRYRVTFEEIEEPKEVLAERLLKLWQETDNYHHWQTLQDQAKLLGIELPRKQFGENRSK